MLTTIAQICWTVGVYTDDYEKSEKWLKRSDFFVHWKAGYFKNKNIRKCFNAWCLDWSPVVK